MVRLKGKVAIVTGGGRGIGRAISLAFSREGANVIIAARSLSHLNQTLEEIRFQNVNVFAIPTDVSSEQQVKEMVQKTIKECGRIDILVNNSGIIGPISPIVEMNLNEWNETLAINLTGAMLCSREVLKHMIPRKTGNIINIVSEGGRLGDGRGGRHERGAYCCSKMALIGLTETLSVEVGSYGIRVNAISPGAVSGERIDHLLSIKAKDMGISLDGLKKKPSEITPLAE